MSESSRLGSRSSLDSCTPGGDDAENCGSDACTYYSWSKKSKGKLVRGREKTVGKLGRSSNKKIKDIFKYYLKKCMDLPVAGMSQTHIKLICGQLKPQDEIRFAVRLELAGYPDGADQKAPKTRARYLAIIERTGSARVSAQKLRQSAVFGFDILAETKLVTIGMKFPLLKGVKISFHGDGKLMIFSSVDQFSYVFRPVSVQAMWYCFQSLERSVNDLDLDAMSDGEHQAVLDWIDSYNVCSSDLLVSEWKTVADTESYHTLSSPMIRAIVGNKLTDMEKTILDALQEVTPTFDLEEINAKVLRNAVQQYIGVDSPIQLDSHKSTFDKLMMVACDQAEAPSKILDNLFLGNEGNATNKRQLKKMGISHILNMTNEIDNVFPKDFTYLKIQVNDEPSVNLLKHWNKTTYNFIHSAITQGGKVLVHCRMGKSRSAATVIAYVMKSQSMSVAEAFDFVKTRRPVICPNLGFMEQLREYSGILEANRNKNNPLWTSELENTDDLLHKGSAKSKQRKSRRLSSISDVKLPPIKSPIDKFESGMFDFCRKISNNSDRKISQAWSDRRKSRTRSDFPELGEFNNEDQENRSEPDLESIGAPGWSNEKQFSNATGARPKRALTFTHSGSATGFCLEKLPKLSLGATEGHQASYQIERGIVKKRVEDHLSRISMQQQQLGDGRRRCNSCAQSCLSTPSLRSDQCEQGNKVKRVKSAAASQGMQTLINRFDSRKSQTFSCRPEDAISIKGADD